MLVCVCVSVICLVFFGCVCCEYVDCLCCLPSDCLPSDNKRGKEVSGIDSGDDPISLLDKVIFF